MLRQSLHEIVIPTRGRGLYDFTGEVNALVRAGQFQNGLATLHVRHTSASLLIQENADPEVQRDLERFFSRLVKSLSENYVGSCFRGKGWLARRDEGAYPWWICDRGATPPDGLFPENPPGGGALVRGLRWLGRYSPLRGCSGLAASTTNQIPRRRTPQNFQTGSKDGDSIFRHRDEGDDDMAAHIRTALTTVNLSVPIASGSLALGTWQGIYLWEHRTHGHRRRIAAHLLGE